jgi:ParB-like chromosome segregation protein Spo0J
MPKTRTLPLEQLAPDPDNERSSTDKEAISRQADSIRQHGIRV